MNCLVLGGSGFIGSHVCEAILRAGHSVRVLQRAQSSQRNLLSFIHNVEVIQGDFCSDADVDVALSGIDAVLHFVSTTVPKSSNDDPVYDVESNVIPTIRLLDLSRRKGVQKLIFASSGGTVYGIPQVVPIPETHSTNPISTYGIQKLSIEKYLEVYKRNYGLDYAVMRISNPYGDRQDGFKGQGLIGATIVKAIQNEPVEIWGDGSVIRDYIHVSDVASAAVQLLTYSGEHTVFNIGTGTGKSIRQVIDTIGQGLKRPVDVRYSTARTFDVPVNVLDVTRATIELRWSPVVDFKEGIERTLEHLTLQLARNYKGVTG